MGIATSKTRESMTWRLFAADDRHGATLRRWKYLKSSRHQRTQIVKAVTACDEHNNRDVERRRVLLVREIAIRGEKNLEMPHGQAEQFPISLAGPTHLGCGPGLVP